MIIDCISDLHGFFPYFPDLKGGDLLIVAGDLTAHDTEKEHKDFIEWLETSFMDFYTNVIVIGGNHDMYLEKHPNFYEKHSKKRTTHYLCNSGVDIGVKVWGSPNSLWFHGVNPQCKAFMTNEATLERLYNEIPSSTEILVTHTPPLGMFDQVGYDSDGEPEETGSLSLNRAVLDSEHFPNLKLHVFGHIHEWGGKRFDSTFATFVNASICDVNYRPVNKPVRVELK